MDKSSRSYEQQQFIQGILVNLCIVQLLLEDPRVSFLYNVASQVNKRTEKYKMVVEVLPPRILQISTID